MFFYVFLLLFAAVDGLGWVGDGPDVVGNGWDVMVRCMEPYNPPKKAAAP